MPLITIGIQQQKQAASAGFKLYPGLPGFTADVQYGDEFKRDDLTPTDAYQLYTVNVNGTGTATIGNDGVLLLDTSNTIGNDVDVRTTGYAFTPDSNEPTNFHSQYILEIRLALLQTADTEAFVGFVFGDALSALPVNTTIHMGLEFDASGDANWQFVDANGTTKNTNDTGVAASTGAISLKITWRDANDATMEILNGSGVSQSSRIVTALDMSNIAGLQIHCFIQTEGAAVKTVRIEGWRIQAT